MIAPAQWSWTIKDDDLKFLQITDKDGLRADKLITKALGAALGSSNSEAVFNSSRTQIQKLIDLC